MQGPTGPSGGIDTYASVVTSGSFSSQSVNTNQPIIFDTILSVGGTMSYNNTNGQFTVNAAGIYEITYGGRWVGTNGDNNPVVAIRIGGTEVSGTQIDGNINNNAGGAGYSWVTGSFILPVNTVPTTIEIIFGGANAGGSMDLIAGYPGSPGAFATIKKIN